MKISSSAAAVGSMAAAQGHMAEGNTSMGRLGMGAMERQKVSTAEGAGLAGHRMVDNMANSATGLRGDERLDFGMQTGGGVAAGQKDLLSAGLAGDSGRGSVTVPGSANAAGARSQDANGGLGSSTDAQTYDKSAQLAHTAMKMGTTGGDFKKEADWLFAENEATRKVFGSAENLSQFLQDNKEASVGQLAGAKNAYAGAQENGFKGSWKDFNAISSELKAGADFNNSKAAKEYAERNNMSLDQLQGQFAGVDVGKKGGEMKAYAGTPVTQDQAKAVMQSLSALGADASKADYERVAKEHNIAGGGKAVESLQGLHQNLQNTPKSAASDAAFVKSAQQQLRVGRDAGATAEQTAQTNTEKQIGGMAATRGLAGLMGTSVEDAENYLKSHEGQMAYAKYSNMEKYAGTHGDSFFGLAQKSQNTFGLALDAAGAKAYGLKGGAGLYSASVDANGNAVFTDLKSGRQSQVGTFEKQGFHQQNFNLVETRTGTRGEHGSSMKHLSEAIYQNVKPMEINGQRFQAGGQLSVVGDTFTFTGKTVGSDEIRTTEGVVKRDTKGNIVSYSPITSDGKGGTSFSENTASQEIINGKTGQLKMALKGDDTTQSNYAKALGAELNRTLSAGVSDKAAAKESVYTGVEGNLGVQTPVGGAKAVAGARLEAGYEQQRQVQVKAFEARVVNALAEGRASGKHENQVAAEIFKIRGEYVKQGVTAMRHQGENIKPPAPKNIVGRDVV